MLFVGLLTLLSMGRVWAVGFWSPGPENAASAQAGVPRLVVIAGLSAVTVAITLWAEPLFALTLRAAHQLLQREDYVRAVLGGS